MFWFIFFLLFFFSVYLFCFFFFFSSRRRHTRCSRDWSSDVCSCDCARVPARAVVEGQRNQPAVAAPAVDRCTEPREPLDGELARAAAGTRFADDRGCSARGE